MEIAIAVKIPSSLATSVVAAGIPHRGGGTRRARDDGDRPQIVADTDHTGRFATNVVVRNSGNGTAKNIAFAFPTPPESTSGHDVAELPHSRKGTNFVAPQTDLPAARDSCRSGVRNPREKGLTGGRRIDGPARRKRSRGRT